LLAEALLAGDGHDVTLACDGREAVEISGQKQFEVILMDLQMPEMDGYEATRRIRDREQATHQHVPIFALSANSLDDDEQLRSKGFDACMPKPIQMRRLYELLESIRTSN